jgi:hypothetical protein
LVTFGVAVADPPGGGVASEVSYVQPAYRPSPQEELMPRVVHSEIHAADVQRAVTFYTEVFGWTSEDWSSFAGSPY